MVVRTIKTNEKEANHIADNKLRYIIRSADERFRVGEVFNFLCYKNGKPVPHRGNKFGYVITIIQDYHLAPIEKGYQIIGFRRV